METKASAPISLLAGEQTSAWITAYYEINQLKQLYRQGWLQRGIPESLCESVAEHSFSMALLALLLMDQVSPELDRQQVLLMALIHDLGEIYAGDFTPQDGVPSDEKHALEAKAFQQVFGELPGGQREPDREQLDAIAHIVVGAAEAISRERDEKGKYENIFDFVSRVDLRAVNKRALEALIGAGAFDSLGYKRAELRASFDRIAQFGQST